MEKAEGLSVFVENNLEVFKVLFQIKLSVFQAIDKLVFFHGVKFYLLFCFINFTTTHFNPFVKLFNYKPIVSDTMHLAILIVVITYSFVFTGASLSSFFIAEIFVESSSLEIFFINLFEVCGDTAIK